MGNGLVRKLGAVGGEQNFEGLSGCWRVKRCWPHDLNRAGCRTQDRKRDAAQEKSRQGGLSAGADHDEVGFPLPGKIRNRFLGEARQYFRKNFASRIFELFQGRFHGGLRREFDESRGSQDAETGQFFFV